MTHYHYTSFRSSPTGAAITTFRGRVEVYDKGRYAWSETSPIHRMTREDAINDAKKILN